MYQPTNVQKLFAAALDDGRSTLSTDDLSHWVAAAVSGAVLEAEKQWGLVAAWWQSAGRLGHMQPLGCSPSPVRAHPYTPSACS